MKVVINNEVGSFTLSELAVVSLYEKGSKYIFVENRNEELQEWEADCLHRKPPGFPLTIIHNGKKITNDYESGTKSCDGWKVRCDPLLVSVVEELGGEKASYSGTMKIVEIPDEVGEDGFEIGCQEDGREWVAEKHRKWD